MRTRDKHEAVESQLIRDGLDQGFAVSSSPYIAGEIYDLLARAGKKFTAGQMTLADDLRELYYRGTKTREGGALVFNGAHVVLNDKGAYFDIWKIQLAKKNLTGVERDPKKMESSHASDGPQLEILFPLGWGCVLCGKLNGHTWFQTEAAPWGQGQRDVVGHLASSSTHFISVVASYLTSGVTFGYTNTPVYQVGPMGYSTYSEKNHSELHVDDVPASYFGAA